MSKEGSLTTSTSDQEDRYKKMLTSIDTHLTTQTMMQSAPQYNGKDWSNLEVRRYS